MMEHSPELSARAHSDGGLAHSEGGLPYSDGGLPYSDGGLAYGDGNLRFRHAASACATAATTGPSVYMPHDMARPDVSRWQQELLEHSKAPAANAKKIVGRADARSHRYMKIYWPGNGGPYNMEARRGYNTFWVAARNVHT